MDIFAQLKGLFLQALPTVVLILVFYAFLRSQFFAPLEKMMAERSAKIEGARKAAEASLAAAAELERAYEAALRKARGEVYAELDAARRIVLDERSNLIRAARDHANEMIRVGKAGIVEEGAAARARLEAETPALATEIVRVILTGTRPGARPSARPSGGSGGVPQVSGDRG